MMTRPALFACWFLTVACGGGTAEPARTLVQPAASVRTAAPTALDTPVEPAAAPTRDEQLAEIRAVFGRVESDPSLTAAPYKVECQGNETRVEGRTFVRDGALQKAHLAISPPGDTSVEYRFYYDRSDLVFALYRVVGYAGDFKHTIEYRYYFAAGEPLQCLRKDAKGSEAEVAAQLPSAENKKDDCRFAAKTLALGNALEPGSGDADTLTKLACAL